MTKLLEEAFRKASELPEDRQDFIGRMLLQVVDEGEAFSRLTDEQIAEVRRSLAQAEAGDFASDEAVMSVFHGARDRYLQSFTSPTQSPIHLSPGLSAGVVCGRLIHPQAYQQVSIVPKQSQLDAPGGLQ